MSTASAEPDARTIADLLADLGDVPASRVRLRPWPGTATGQGQEVFGGEGGRGLGVHDSASAVRASR